MAQPVLVAGGFNKRLFGAHRSGRTDGRPARNAAFALAVLLFLTIGLPGCARTQRTVEIPPPPAIHGPEYLHGTIGSFTQPRGFMPIPVGGYGVVVNLPGTGSADVPSFLRNQIENRMRRYGFGNPARGGGGLNPRDVLASPQTAIVEVRGLIPPAAVRGSRFDLVVNAESSTQTLSLQGGRLWTTELSENGLNRQGLFTRSQAIGRGSLIIDPFAEDKPRDERVRLEREAVVLSGGVVQRDRVTELVLNRPDPRLSRMIAARINERFPRSSRDRLETAVAMSDQLIRINVPARFHNDPRRLLRLISYTFVDQYDGFEVVQANRMAELLVRDPSLADTVAEVWEVLGRTILPVIAVYYDHSHSDIRFAALQAGARLGDPSTARRLAGYTQNHHPDLRRRAAALMVAFPGHPEVIRALQVMLDDDDRQVRIQAYETLAAQDSRLIATRVFGDESYTKFVLDLVPAQKPLIYISQVGIPRIAIFSPNTGFKSPMLAQLWENRLMLRVQSPRSMMPVFYQPYGGSRREPTIAPTVANLVRLMGHRPTLQDPSEGLDLTFSQVINAIQSLHRQGLLEAELEIQLSPLAALLAEYNRTPGGLHPEFADDGGLLPAVDLGQGDPEMQDPLLDDDWLPMPLPPRDQVMAPRSEPAQPPVGLAPGSNGEGADPGEGSAPSEGGDQDSWLPIPIPDEPDGAVDGGGDSELPIPLPMMD